MGGVECFTVRWRVPLLLVLGCFLLGCQTTNSQIQSDNSAKLFEEGQYDHAIEAAQITLQQVRSSSGENHQDVATALDNLAVLQQEQSLHDEAEKNYQQALKIRQSVLKADHPELVYSYNNLGSIYRQLQNDTKAKQHYLKAKALLSKHSEISAVSAITSNGLGEITLQSGDLSSAQRLFQEALGILEQIDLNAQNVTLKSAVLTNLAQIYRYRANLPTARAYLDQAKLEQESLLGVKHPNVAIAINNIAELEFYGGHYDAARKAYLRALPILEQSYGTNHPRVAVALNNLAAVDKAEGDLPSALKLSKKALSIQESVLGENHPDLASSLSLIAGIYYSVHDYQRAAEVLERVNQLLTLTFGKTHPILADGLTSLGEIERLRGRYDSAEQAYQKAASILISAVGHKSPSLADIYNNWAALEYARAAYNRALVFYRKAENIVTGIWGESHPDLAAIKSGKAKVYAAMGDGKRALDSIRQASNIVEQRFHSKRGTPLSENILSELNQARNIFIQHLDQLNLSLKRSKLQGALIDESFKLAQLAHATKTEGALSQMAARFSSGSDKLALLIRDRQDLLEKNRLLTEKLKETLVIKAELRDAKAEGSLRESLTSIQKSLKRADREIVNSFPQFSEFSNPKPASIRDIQQLLGPEEALISIIVGEENSYIWAISKNRKMFQSVKLSSIEMTNYVRQLRLGLDPMAASQVDFSGLPLIFPGQVAYDLYNQLFGGVALALNGISKLHIVTDAALESLPLQILLTKRPSKPDLFSIDFPEAPWLIKKYAISYLPAISSFRALRRYTKASKASESFLGIGDPILANHPTINRANSSAQAMQVASRGSFKNRSKNVRRFNARGFYKGGLGNISVVSQMPSLPETAEELNLMRQFLDGKTSSLILGNHARESVLKNSIDFTRYQVVAFATHGLVAGEIKGFSEPALVLTPPEKASVLDDGLLTASEIAKLSFDADLIILSACNTASSSGEFGAEGLSGLAKAFFYAGSRALFVSHWAVLSKPTVKLTTSMLHQARDLPENSLAEAHRGAVLAMLTDNGNPHYAHPAIWAPFIVVGE